MLVATFSLALAAMAFDDGRSLEVAGGQPQTSRSITLAEAFQLGLTHSRVFQRVESGQARPTPGGMAIVAPSATGSTLDAIGAPLPAAPRRADRLAAEISVVSVDHETSTWKTRADLMAHLRSIEQTYWALAQAQVELWSRETALKMVEEVLAKEKAEPAGRTATADIAEVEASVEQLKIEVVKITHRNVVEERKLRNVLGLLPTDNTRLVTSSGPQTIARDVHKEDDQAQMLARAPQVVLQRAMMDAAEVRLAARKNLIDDPARQMLERERDEQLRFLQQVVAQASRVLAESESKVVEGMKNSETAARLKKAADSRLHAQQAYYDEGRITCDRLVDAIVQWSNALSQESQYWAEAAVAVAALEESKGTLLDFDGVTLVRDQASPGVANEARATAVSPARAPSSRIRLRVAGFPLIEVEVEDNRR